MADKKSGFSIFETVSELREQLAIFLGLFGIILLLLSIAIPEPYKSNLVLIFVGRLGEVLITTGLIVYIIEHHTISRFLTKEISISIIQDLFRYYFNKEEMEDLIVKFTRQLNRYETIDEDVWELYKRHGIVELFSEPVREDLHITYKYLGDVENAQDSIYLFKHWSFRAKNTAKQTLREDLSKKINKNGLIHGTRIPVDASFNTEKEEVKKYIQQQSKLFFNKTLSGAGGVIEKTKMKPDYFHESDFDKDNGLPKNFKPTEQINLFLVYGIDDVSRIDGRKYLIIELYLNEKIPPGGSLGIEFSYQAIVPDFNISTFDFQSYTLGFCFLLDFGDMFKTDVGERIIGKGLLANKSEKGLTFAGWIMPHSAVSCAWCRK